VNIKHIEPLDKLVKIARGASDEDVLKAIQESGLEEFMKEVVKPKFSPIK
jgi:large subunit ribosomal protein L14e